MVRNRLICLLSLLLCLSTLNAQSRRPSVKPGIEVLRERGFEGLHGKRVGLVTNPSGVDSHLKSTIDILFEAPEVNLVTLFGPEHGVRGDIYAGGSVVDGNDTATGLPVYSLYGRTRKATPEMLKGLDIVVYDIQDVGSRSYTFISSLGLLMRACAEQGIEVMVLDRPNPLGGRKVEGNYVEPGCYSFVSQFRIPYIHGLTVGELAMLINEEGLNLGEKGNEEPLSCKLSVVPMEGWTRDMLYADTGLPWVLPSPNIPSSRSAICYPSAGLCGEFNNYLQIGVGYTLPFEVFAATWLDAEALKARLDSYEIPGVAFRIIYYKPFSGSCAGKLVKGVQYFYTDYDRADLCMTQFYVMRAVKELYPDKDPFKDGSRNAMFDKVCGSRRVREMFSASFDTAEVREFWMKDVEDWLKLSKRYYLY